MINFVADILRKRSKIIELKVYVNQLLEKLGSWKYTLDRLNQLDQEVRNEMQKLGGNPELDKILDTLKVIEWRNRKRFSNKLPV